MAEPTISPAAIERATVDRFEKFTNYLRSKKAYPMICIAQGAGGYLGRETPEPILCIPQELSDSGSVDWLVEVLEATLQIFKGQQAKLRPDIGMTMQGQDGSYTDPARISLESMFGPPPGGTP